jgi:hypothetical protein
MSRKSTAEPALDRRWRIIEIRKKGQLIATVGARDAAAAIAEGNRAVRRHRAAPATAPCGRDMRGLPILL